MDSARASVAGLAVGLLAVNNHLLFGRIGREDRLARFCTLGGKEAAVVKSKTSAALTLLGVKARCGQTVVSSKKELGLDEPKRPAACRADDGGIERNLRGVVESIRQVGRAHRLGGGGWRRLILGPIGTTGERFLFCERKKFLRERLVVAVGREAKRKKFAPLAGPFHMLSDARQQGFIIRGGVLLVENAVLLSVELVAAEKVFAVLMAAGAVKDVVAAVVKVIRERAVAHLRFATRAAGSGELVAESHHLAEHGDVQAGFDFD